MAGAKIGPLNVLRNLRLLEVGTNSIIGQWNWISAAPEFCCTVDTAGKFRIGVESALTSRHYVDCSGGVDIGSYTTVAGARTTIITHGIDVATNRQVASPVSILDYSLVGSNSKLVPGACVPARCVIAMGAVVSRGLKEEYALYAGVPARVVKRLDEDGQYFHRELGPVVVSELPPG